MEKAYWLGRQRASLKMAQSATSSRARLAHYDLAGRYSVNALSAEPRRRVSPTRSPRRSMPVERGRPIKDSDDA
jgi:hypothetical protein